MDFQLSDLELSSESDVSLDLFEDDPTFETAEVLEAFMKTCDVSKADASGESICWKKAKDAGVRKICTCMNCQDIWSEGFEHLCCQQIDKWVLLYQEYFSHFLDF